jgi:hypothetical protein
MDMNNYIALKWYMDKEEEKKKKKVYDCYQCLNRDCPHRNAYRRLPREEGGLGLCERLTGKYTGV